MRTPDVGVVVDLTGKRNGRGAYVCDQPACWDRILNQPSLLNQALKTQVSEEERVAIAGYKPDEAAEKVDDTHPERLFRV